MKSSTSKPCTAYGRSPLAGLDTTRVQILAPVSSATRRVISPNTTDSSLPAMIVLWMTLRVSSSCWRLSLFAWTSRRCSTVSSSSSRWSLMLAHWLSVTARNRYTAGHRYGLGYRYRGGIGQDDFDYGFAVVSGEQTHPNMLNLRVAPAGHRCE